MYLISRVIRYGDHLFDNDLPRDDTRTPMCANTCHQQNYVPYYTVLVFITRHVAVVFTKLRFFKIPVSVFETKRVRNEKWAQSLLH